MGLCGKDIWTLLLDAQSAEVPQEVVKRRAKRDVVHMRYHSLNKEKDQIGHHKWHVKKTLCSGGKSIEASGTSALGRLRDKSLAGR